MSAGVRLRGVRKGKALAVDSTMLVKRSVSPDGRIDPLSKVSLDPGVQSAPHGATRCKHRIPNNPYVLARRRGFDSPRLHPSLIDA